MEKVGAIILISHPLNDAPFCASFLGSRDEGCVNHSYPCKAMRGSLINAAPSEIYGQKKRVEGSFRRQVGGFYDHVSKLGKCIRGDGLLEEESSNCKMK
ncbi:hypothetical protein CEXT_327861 [Caerostris extrusa]|uniref:Uncharacterized protein n=1 Tax=Caerostris extrusa TaxID=172846 RepID=A0AAV4QPC9_CAEEX|nr:hypothetical protein CEXT_327861 [Caerostris extrusa]